MTLGHRGRGRGEEVEWTASRSLRGLLSLMKRSTLHKIPCFSAVPRNTHDTWTPKLA